MHAQIREMCFYTFSDIFTKGWQWIPQVEKNKETGLLFPGTARTGMPTFSWPFRVWTQLPCPCLAAGPWCPVQLRNKASCLPTRVAIYQLWRLVTQGTGNGIWHLLTETESESTHYTWTPSNMGQNSLIKHFTPLVLVKCLFFFFFCQSLIWTLEIPRWSRQTQPSFHGAYVFLLETEKRINWLGNSSSFGESSRSRGQCRMWVWGAGRVAYFRRMNKKASLWRWCLSWHPTEWRRKPVPSRGSSQCKSPEAGLKMDYCWWTGSLARWLERSREGAFSYKPNQHWGSDLDFFFFFGFWRKHLILLLGSHRVPEQGPQR